MFACSKSGEAYCFAHVVTDVNGVIRTFNPSDVSGAAKKTSVPAGYGPSALQSAYNITSGGTAATVVAIIAAYSYPNAESDLAVYRSYYGLPPCTTANGCFTKVQLATNLTFNLGWAQETALDLDMVSAICQNCKILLVEAPTPTYPDLAAAVNYAASQGAHAINNSYGGQEAVSYPSNILDAYNHPGIAVTAASGDSGYGVLFPASSPYVTAVGGTSLVVDTGTSRGWSEVAWSGAGSGLFLKPTWQTDALCTMRTVADVSAVADPATGVAVYGPLTQQRNTSRAAWQVYGGTSVASPIIAGVYGVNGGAVNYGSDPYAAVSQLYDVISGANGTSCGGTYLCTAVPGYDGPTGLGTPNGINGF